MLALNARSDWLLKHRKPFAIHLRETWVGFLPEIFEIIAGISYLKYSFLCFVIFTQFRWFAVDFYAFNCCLLMTKLRHALENDKIAAVILTTWKYLFIPPPNLQIIPSILLKFDFKSCLFDISLGGGRGEYKCSFSHVGWMTCTEL